MSDKPEAMTCDVNGVVTSVPSYRQLEDRIRELETVMDEVSRHLTEAKIANDEATKLDQELLQRIAKAKEILAHRHVHPGEIHICPACRALAALETQE